MLGCPLRIGHELGSETLVIGDRLLSKSARFELALAKQYRDLGHRKGERIGHRYLLLSDNPHMTEGQRGDSSLAAQSEADPNDLFRLLAPRCVRGVAIVCRLLD